jgi:GTP-dependent phosphoenolpyruvate carboxykinase
MSRHIQIILRLFSSPAEILSSFDIDSCAVGFDGTNVYAAHRAFIAFVTQINTVDRFYFSRNYELRLFKYALRGFEILVPSQACLDQIDSQVQSIVIQLTDSSLLTHSYFYRMFRATQTLFVACALGTSSTTVPHLICLPQLKSPQRLSSPC